MIKLQNASSTFYRKPQQNHHLRSSNKLFLSEPVSQNKNKFEDRAFSFVAPKLWNNLPDSVRNAITLDSFKKNLKTHLFQKFYQSYTENFSVGQYDQLSQKD